MNKLNQNYRPAAVASEPSRPAPLGENLAATSAFLAATETIAAADKPTWPAWQEDDSSFFMPQRCTPLDDF